jgi:predicted dehydrogenase
MIRVAVVGAGHWGPNLISNFHSSERSRVCWVVDREPQRRAAVAKRFPGVATSADFADVLVEDVDAVVIATPTTTHFEIAKAALEAGKHVLVEKPLTHSVETSSELCELAAKAQRILMVGHVFVFNSASRHIKRCIAAGDLGRIYYISMERTNLGPIRVDVDAAWDLAAHDISMASYWLAAEPLSVSAVGGSWINEGIADAVFASVRYPDEILVHLHASWLNPRKVRDITIVGDKQMLTFDDISLSEPLRLYDKQVSEERSQPHLIDSFSSFRMSVRDGDVHIPKVAMSEPLKNECEHFLDCIRDGTEPLSGPREGLGVVRTLEAIGRSLDQRGREVEVEQA